MNPVDAGHLPGLLGHELRNPLAAAMSRIMLAREMLDAGDPRTPVLDTTWPVPARPVAFPAMPPTSLPTSVPAAWPP